MSARGITAVAAVALLLVFPAGGAAADTVPPVDPDPPGVGVVVETPEPTGGETDAGSRGSDETDVPPPEDAAGEGAEPADAEPSVDDAAALALDEVDPYMCAWRVMSNKTIVNVAFPDANATYWVLPYLMGPETTITLNGSFPFARYLSLNTYDAGMDTIDTLSDVVISPDPGSVNPFRTVVTDPSLPRHWTATVVPYAGDHALNEIAGVRTPPGLEPVLGFVILRIYAPTDQHDPAAGVPLPAVTYHPGGGLPSRTVEPCTEPFDPATATGPAGQALVAAFDRFIAEASSGSFPGGVAEAHFANPVSTSGLFPNGDNKYVATPLSHLPGRILVVRGKAPTFVDTEAGQSVADTAADLRYWSMCQNHLLTPFPVVDCKADFETALDADGYYTYVVAAQGEVPQRALDDPTVTVIEWGSTNVLKVLFMRNMLPSEGFYPFSVQYSQQFGTDPAASMAAYYPQAMYCQADAFQQGGVDGCVGPQLASSGPDAGKLALLSFAGLGLIGAGLAARRRHTASVAPARVPPRGIDQDQGSRVDSTM